MNNTQKPAPQSGIKVTVHIPEKVPESTKQRKINIIYDILSKVEKSPCNSSQSAL
ncbi:MAG: hypothetical protein LBD23_09355 [Oscillospiraceae bacterium]|nr:hypothetical protein [Oscillospiraceae bacterium]